MSGWRAATGRRAMPARTGRQYLNGLREQEREVWIGGERVKDVTTHPGLAGGARAIAALYDMQCDPKYRDADDLHLADDGRSGRPVVHQPAHARGTGSAPRHDAELGALDLRHDGALARLHERDVRRLGRRRRLLRRAAARVRREHAALLRVHPRERPGADALADQPAAQPQRLRHVQAGGRHRAAGDARDQPRAGGAAARACWRRSGRSRDEIAVYSPRLGQYSEDHSPFALAFSIPCGTPGLRFLCRDSFDLGRSHFDHPLGSRFEEMDCIVFFDDVEVPWDRVFLLRRCRRC